jgi:hypothetical protein
LPRRLKQTPRRPTSVAQAAANVRRRAASLEWWTPARRAARSALIRRYHEEGRYPAAPPVRVWTDEERAEQGERTKALWAAGVLGNPTHLVVLSEKQLRAWAAGRHDGQGDIKRQEWAAGVFDHLAARIRELWRSGHPFGVGRKGLRRWRGGLKGELLARFPEHAEWINGLSDADLVGLLSTNQEHDGDGKALGGVLKNLFGEGRDRAEAS